MNVVHVITGLGDGGAEAVLYRLCVHDAENRHTVVSLADDGKYGQLLRDEGIAVYCLNLRRGGLNLRALYRLWCLIRQVRPDVVQTWMYHADLLGGLISRLAGVRRVVWGIHHTTLEKGKSSRSTIWIVRLLSHLSRSVPKRIAVCAREAMNGHERLGYSTELMRVIPNGYDLAIIARDVAGARALRTACGIPGEVPLLGMVARFEPQKDHVNLLAALALLRSRSTEFRCVLVGAGLEPNSSSLSAELTSYGLGGFVQLLGQRTDIPAVMTALDVHVLSSAFGEAFPNVLAEAMACGTPCVTTDVGDAALIVGDTGWVVPPRDHAALAYAIEDALEVRHGSGWMVRREQARGRIKEHFGIERMVSAYGALWRETLA